MAEESGKGVALVILGIVAIIAIVGLVLLFTGAKKAAVGEFAVPGVKEYGGAIRGVYDPYSRAFAGRSLEFPSGADEIYSGLSNTDKVTLGQSFGEDITRKAEQQAATATYNRQYEQIPAQVACQWLGFLSNQPNLGVSADVNEARTYMDQGRECLAISSMNADVLAVKAGEYGLTRDNVMRFVAEAQANGNSHCCANPGLNVR